MRGLCKRTRSFLVIFIAGFVGMLGTAAGQGAASCSNMESDYFTLRSDRRIPLLKSRTAMASILIAVKEDGDETRVNVNSDGSPRAYHLLDPEGTKYALNNMYSGGVQVFENGQEIRFDQLEGQARVAEIRRYYDVFRRFVSENNNFGVSESTYRARNDRAYRVGDDFGLSLDPPAPRATVLAPSSAEEAALQELWTTPEAAAPSDYNCLACRTSDCRVCFRKGIIKFDAARPCLRRSGRYAGFLVNETSLDKLAGNKPDAENDEDSSCGSPIRLDVEKLPGVVLPSGRLIPDDGPGLKAQRGDIVVGFNPATGRWAFGIVSDDDRIRAKWAKDLPKGF